MSTPRTPRMATATPSKVEYDGGYWCGVCHQKHYQVSPACERRRRQRDEHEARVAALRERFYGGRTSEELVRHLFTEHPAVEQEGT